MIHQGLLANTGFIKLPIGDGLAVWAPAKSITDSEFFLVDPVETTIEGLIVTTGRQGANGMIRERFNVNMVLPDIGHMGSCGTEFRKHKRGWSGLGSSQLFQSFNLQVINPVITARITAPDAL